MLEVSNEPLVTIRVPDRPNQASEPYLGWIHLEVLNSGYKRASKTRSVEQARLRLHINDQEHYLMFRTPGGPEEEADLIKGKSMFVPLILRSGIDIVADRIGANVVYITDKPYLKNAFREDSHLRGQQRIRCEVWSKGKMLSSALFKLLIPSEGEITMAPE